MHHQAQAWMIIFSFIPGAGILLIHQLIAHGKQDVMLLFLEPVVAIAFGISFFVPIWSRINLNVEGDLLLVRFSGKGSRILSVVRNLFLVVLIIPLLIAVQLNSIAHLEVWGLNSKAILLAVVALSLVILNSGYQFNRMIRLEFIIAVITVLGGIAHGIWSNNGHITLSFFQQGESIDWYLWLPPLLFFWWFAGLADMPDMRAQKLLNARLERTQILLMAIPYLILFALQSIFLWKPLHPKDPLFSFLMVVVLLNLMVFVLSLCFWANSLFYQVSARSKYKIISQMSQRERLVMSLIIMMAIFWIWRGTKTQDLFTSVIFMTAGVGPVYLLRWIWYRINAWTQLSAMIGGIVCPVLIKSMFPHFSLFELIATSGVLNCVGWLVVLFLTQNKEENEVAKNFIRMAGSREQFLKFKSWISFGVLLLLFFFSLAGLGYCFLK